MRINTSTTECTFNSIMVAVLIGSQYLNFVAAKFGLTGFLTPIILIVFIMLFVSIAVFRKGKIIHNPRLAILISTVLLFYLLTIAFAPNTTISIVDFFAFCIIPVLVGSLAIVNHELVLRILMILLCFGLPVFPSLFEKANHSLRYDAVTLSTAYAIVPMIMAGIVHFVYFRKNQKLYVYALYAITCIFLVPFILNSYRGPLFTIIITFVLIWMDKDDVRKTPKKFMFSIIFLILAVFVYYNLFSILYFVRDFFSRFGVNIATIEKTLYYADDITDGRTDLYALSLDFILRSPIWGHGISTYANYVPGVDYPHNFILQFLFDGGLILLSIIGFTIFPSFKSIFKFKEYQPIGRVSLIILLIGVEVTRAFFSGNVWRIIQFWLLFGMVINQYDNNSVAMEEIKHS